MSTLYTLVLGLLQVAPEELKLDICLVANARLIVRSCQNTRGLLYNDLLFFTVIQTSALSDCARPAIRCGDFLFNFLGDQFDFFEQPGVISDIQVPDLI